MGLRVKDLDALKEELRNMPAPDRRERELTLGELVRELAEEIKLLRERGYEFAEVCELLKQRGISTTPKSLRQSYYAATRATAGAKPSKRKRTRKLPATAPPPPSSPVASALAEAPVQRAGTFTPRPDHSDL